MAAMLRRLLAAWLLAMAAVAAAQEAGIEHGPAPAWVAPPPALPEAQEPRFRLPKLAYLARDTQVLARGGASERYEYFAIRINQPTALSDAGTIAIPHSAAFQRAALHLLRIRREGRLIDLIGQVPFRVLSQESSLNQGVLHGNRTATAQVPDLRVGDVLEYAYVVAGVNPVFGDRPAFQIVWNSALPLALRRVRVVDAAARLDVRVQSPRGAEPLDLRRVDSALGRETIVEGRNPPVAMLEPNLPAGFDPYISLTFTPYESWQDVRRWADALFRTPPAAAPAHAELLARLKKLPRRAAVAEAVRFVQDDIRYFSLAIGENAYRPYPPAEVVARRYGDCKDKSLLLARLLAGLGVEAHPALVSTQRRHRIGRFAPTPGVFDHAIVNFRLDGRDYWLDPTRPSQGTAFDRQGTALAGALALRVGSDDADLVAIPEAGESRLDVTETVELKALDAPVAFQVDSRLTGALAERLREIHNRRDRQANEREYRETFARRYGGVSARQPVQVRDEPASGALLVAESYEVGDFFRNEGLDKKFATLGAGQLLGWLAAGGERERSHPFAIPGGGAAFSYEARVVFPPTIAGREDPIAQEVANEWFRLEASRSFRGSAMRYRARLDILKAEVAAADYPRYLDEVKRARTALLDFVLISPENLVGGGAAPPRRLAERMREETEALVAGLTKAIDRGQLGDGEAAEARVRRGTARVLLGRRAEALEDFNAALRLRPYSDEALSGRALVHFGDGRLSAAEDDLTRAITLGAEAANAYLRRGQVRFVAGRHAEALADFEQAARTNTFGVNRDFMAIWQALAQRALGREVRFRAGAGDEAARWPQPILALVAGAASTADVLRLANSRSADERDSNLCEAHFYIGQLALLQGERAAAVEHFRAALATGVIQFTEYDLAHIMLDRLGETGAAP